MARPDDTTTPRTPTDGPAATAAATGCLLSGWWILMILVLVALIWWIAVPWWRDRSAPVRPVEPAPVEQPLD